MKNLDLLDQDDIFADFDDADLIKNKRVGVRYVRHDINVSLSYYKFFFRKRLNVRLLNVSSGGALIACSAKLAPKQKIHLTLVFDEGTIFNLDAKIVYVINEQEKKYGIQFEFFNNALGDHLLYTQTDLVF